MVRGLGYEVWGDVKIEILFGFTFPKSQKNEITIPTKEGNKQKDYNTNSDLWQK